MTPQEFLGLLYPDGIDRGRLLVWRMKDKAKLSTWHDTTDSAATWATENQDADVYIGVGLSPADFGPHARCEAVRILGVPGFVCDVDVAHGTHKKQALPPTVEDAKALLYGWGLDPTVLIHSGHGLQAWWLLKEPWLFETDDERARAADLSKRLGHAVLARAEKKGWKIDSVFDLARVMRLPGTNNCKNGSRVPVKVLQVDEGTRYNPDDFDILPEVQGPAAKGAAAKIATPSGIEPHTLSKITYLSELDPDFLIIWEAKGPKSWSASEYDLSLASRLVRAGFTDSEIAQAIYHHRITHTGDPNKGRREDYLARTISKAREAAVQDKALEKIADQNRKTHDLGPETQTLDERASLLDSISRTVGIKITGITRIVSEPCTFLLFVDGESINVGTVDNLTTFPKLKDIIAGYRKIIIRSPRKKKDDPNTGWDPIVQALLNCADDIEPDLEDSESGQVVVWINEYFERYPPSPEVVKNKPFIFENIIHFSLSHLLMWVIDAKNEKELTRKRLTGILKSLGIFRVRRVIQDGEKRTTLRSWAIPTSDDSKFQQLKNKI